MRSLFAILAVLILVSMYHTYTKDSQTEDSLASVMEVSDDDSVSNIAQETPDSNDASDEVIELNRALPRSGDWADNLLVNGDFESSLKGWSFDTGVYWSDNGGDAGSGALLINPPEIVSESRTIYSKAVKQCVAINGTSKYAIEARFRYLDRLPDRPSVNRIHLYWYDGTDCSKGGQYGGYIEPNLESQVWQKVHENNLKPSLGAQSAQIRIAQRQDGNNSAEAIWDNVLFIETSKGEETVSTKIGNEIYTKPLGSNYLQNATFDQDLAYWSPKRSRRLAHRVIDDEQHGGVMSASLPHDRDGSMGTGSFSQCVNIGSSLRYELGAQVKVDPESTQRVGGRLRIAWYESLDCEGRYRSDSAHVDVDRDALDWQNLHVDQLTPKSGAKSVSVGIVHSIDGKGQHTMLWDDVYFRAY